MSQQQKDKYQYLRRQEDANQPSQQSQSSPPIAESSHEDTATRHSLEAKKRALGGQSNASSTTSSLLPPPSPTTLTRGTPVPLQPGAHRVDNPFHTTRRVSRSNSLWERVRQRRVSRYHSRSNNRQSQTPNASSGPMLVTATLVVEDDTHDDNEPPIVVNNNNNNNNNAENKVMIVQAVRIPKHGQRRYYVIGFVVIAIVAIVLAVTLGVTLSSSKQEPTPTPAPIPSPAPTIPGKPTLLPLIYVGDTFAPTVSPNTLFSSYTSVSHHVVVWGKFTTCSKYNMPEIEIRCLRQPTTTNTNTSSSYDNTTKPVNALLIPYKDGASCQQVNTTGPPYDSSPISRCQFHDVGWGRGVGGVIAMCLSDNPPLSVTDPTGNHDNFNLQVQLVNANSTATNCDDFNPPIIQGNLLAYTHLGRFCYQNTSTANLFSTTTTTTTTTSPTNTNSTATTNTTLEYQSLNGCLQGQYGFLGSPTVDGAGRTDLFCYQTNLCEINVTNVVNPATSCNVTIDTIESMEAPYGGSDTSCVAPIDWNGNPDNLATPYSAAMIDWLVFAINRRQAFLNAILHTGL